MAELYENPRHYVTEGGNVGNSANGAPSIERMLADLSPEEREEAMQFITAPPSGEEIMRAMQQKNANGEVMNMSVEQYRLFKAHNKTKEVDVIAGIGEAAGTVFEDISRAAGSIVDNPADALQKLTPSVVEAFAQGTRNLYGMAAQSADPNSVFFRMKNALQANGDDEESEYQQFMEAQAFNVHSMRLMTGQDTLIMDKDIINPEMTQVMSYIADPTLFIPFGGIAAKGAVMIGMGEKLAMAAARTQGIRNLVLGGAIKWGVGAPLEFMGGAIRNTIDYGIDTGSRVFETATGVAAKDIASATRVGSLGTAAGSVAGLEINSTLATASRYYAGSLVARNIGETASIYGEQMMKQGKTGRGVLGYAGQAIRDTERAGIKLAPHTKSLLKAIEAVDPLFVYADNIAQGAALGSVIGGGLGYLAGGKEGFAGGVGSGMALGAVGATAGKVVSDVTGNTKIDQMRIQRKLIIEALKENGNENAIGFEAMAAMAEATGDRAFQGYIDGIIAGIDTVNPDAVFKAFNQVQYNMHLKAKGIDPNTGVLLEKSRIFPELNDRTVKADVLGILRDTGGNFAGDPAGFEQAVKSNPAYAKVKPIWNRLDDNAKQVILKQIKDNGDPAFTKSLKGRQLNAHWSDMAYAERATEIVNTLNQKNANSVPAKVAELLKAETRSDKKLTRRGQMLKEKLQADGYIDKDGNVRTSRLKDVEGTQGEFEASAGWAKSRDSSGRTEVVINLDKWAMDSGNRLSLAHELYHSIMLDSVFAPDYIDRLSQKLLGKFDPKTGRILEQALVQPDELMKFFGKYIDNDPSNRGDAETIKRKKEELKKSIEDYRTRGTANRVADATAIPLEHLVEEFGAYYFSKWVKAKPIDYMFRGGEFSGIRGLMEMASDGWLDYWKGKINEKNPQFDFDGMGVSSVSKAFERDGKRVSSRSLDLFMRDIVRIEANRNSNNGFDVNKLSKESREWFLKVNGLRGAAFGQLDQQGNVKKPKLRRYTAEEIRQGKEMFKVMESLPDAAHKDGMRRDGDGNWSGQPNTAQINALVGAGFIQRAWFDRMNRAFDIVNGNGSNVVEFGYLGYSAHIGDGNERVYGAAVPFKNRRAVLIGVDFKVRADGTVYSNLHTLDLKVIEARGNEVWKDPQTRELWKGSRTNMEADFYAYLSNASLPSGHKDRKPSARLLDNSDGLGGQRRDALHQMLGFHKGSDMPYINRPISEIPIGIRHSVTTFSNDGIVNMRVDNKPRYDFNFENAHLDLSRNFMPDEMRQETTPSGGKIIKHATGYNISKQAGDKFKVFDPEGKHLGDFDTVADAGRAAQKHYNDTFDKSVEGKDAPVPPTEIPPSRVGYIDREFGILTDNFVGGKEKFLENTNVLIDRILASPDHLYPKEGKAELLKIRKSIEETGSIKLSELRDLQRLEKINRVHDMKRLPYYNYDYFIELINDLLGKNFDKIGSQYDNMYPMEIKSALHGRLAQIFQDYPNLTAQGLLKKLVVYGSQGSRMFQEATEIGLVDLLKSKIQKTTTPRFLPDGTRVDMAQGVTQPKLEMSEILDFAKAKEIKVTIEEGAKERSGMDTSKYTLGGAKSNYKETAIRINPEYAHGISGHYGKDTIVHFRTTERIDADGNRHLFIEEVQANNTDQSKFTPQEIKDIEIDRDVHLPIFKQILEEGKKRGRFTDTDTDGLTNAERHGEAINPFEDIYSEKENVLQYATREDNWNGVVLNFTEDILEGIATDWNSYFENRGTSSAEFFVSSTVPKALNILYEQIERGVLNPKNANKDFFELLKGELKTGSKGASEGNFVQFAKDIISTTEVSKLIDLVSKDATKQAEWRQYLYDIDQKYNQGYVTYQSYASKPSHIIERITDIETSVQQLNFKSKPLPLTAAKDWTLTALKGIIRQAIRDGLDRITLTHPDDSPTVSHMKGDARKGLYGKLIPEVWGSWLRKYGIEMKQTNKLADATIDTAKGQMAEITNKLHDANKAVLEHFEQVMGGEDATLIQNVVELLAMPVHMADPTIHLKIEKIASRLNDNKLIGLINEVALLKGAEFNAYERINKLREGGVRGDSTLKSDTDAGISAEAIDRGMTFELNDRIKRDFLDGKIQTHAMPAEGGAEGGRTYNKEQITKQFVGRYAFENPDITKGLQINYGMVWGRMRGQDKAQQEAVILRNSKGDIIGQIAWFSQLGTTDDIAVEIDPAYRGKKLQHLLYSEAYERMRANKNTTTIQDIYNQKGLPVKSQLKILGKNSSTYKSAFGLEKKLTYDAFMREMKNVLGDNLVPEDEKYVTTTGKLDSNAWYMPAEGGAEGGRVYDQNSPLWKSGFLGKYAEDNQDRIKNKNIEFVKRRDGSYRITLTDNSSTTKKIGHITADLDMSVKGEGVAEISSNIDPKFRGNKLANVLYSEMAERLRAMGVKYVDGTIVNKDGIPVQVRNTIIGQTYFKGSNKPASMQETASKVQAVQSVYPSKGIGVYNELDFNARYMPAEGVNAPVNEANRSFILDTITGNDNSRRALEEGMKQAKDRKQNFITIDNINPELLRGEAVVMHSPDNAGVEPVQIGRFTVNPRGGMRFPSENPTLGWAGVKAGLGKQINDNGNFNANKGRGWNSGVGLIKGEYSKMKGTHIGLEVFLRNLQKYTDSNVLTERQTIQILKNGFGDIGDTKRPLDTIVEGILAKSARHEAPYTIEGRRTAIEKMTETDGSASLWKYLQSDLTKLESQTDGFSSEGVTNAKQFIKALLEPMYEAVSDPLTRHAKVGEVYGYLMFRSPVTEPPSDVHPSYKYAVQPEKGGSPVQLDILSTPMDARKAFKNRITAGEVSPLPESKAGFTVLTGQKHIPTMRGTFMPAEFTEFKSEQSATGRIMRNARGYVIMLANNKFRVYNPSKAIIGVYTDEEQAKKRIYKEIPKR